VPVLVPKGRNEPEILTMIGRAYRATKRLHPQNALLSKEQGIDLDDQRFLCPISHRDADCVWGTEGTPDELSLCNFSRGVIGIQ
jgi:hypothetical protein